MTVSSTSPCLSFSFSLFPFHIRFGIWYLEIFSFTIQNECFSPQVNFSTFPCGFLTFFPYLLNIILIQLFSGYPIWVYFWQKFSLLFSSVQSLNRVLLFATPWIAAHQASLSITNSQSLLNSCPLSRWCHSAISSSVIPFSSCPQSLPASGSFPMSQHFAWGGQSIGVLAAASVLPMTIQDWFPLGWTVGSPCSPRDCQESSPTPQFKSINFLALCFLHCPTLTSIHDHWKNHSLD